MKQFLGQWAVPTQVVTMVTVMCNKMASKEHQLMIHCHRKLQVCDVIMVAIVIHFVKVFLVGNDNL